MSASAEFTVNSSTVTGAIALTKGSTATFALKSTVGVSTVVWSIVGNHGSTSNPTITPAGYPLGATATMPIPNEDARGYLVECLVNSGIDELGAEDPRLRFRAIVGTIDSSGTVPFVVGETSERGAYGIVPKLNSGSGGSGSSTLLGLTDFLVSSYSGQKGKVPVVSDEEDGLELADVELPVPQPLDPQWDDGSPKIYYVDPANGDDSNSGETDDDAFETLDKAMREVGEIVAGPTVIYVLGDVDASSLGWRREYLGHLAIVGPEPIVAESAIEATAIPDSRHITFGGESWSVNEHIGRGIRATSGDNEGVVRTILGNTATTIHTAPWPNAVAAADTFDIVDFVKLSTGDTGGVVTDVTTPEVRDINQPHLILSGVALQGSFVFTGSVSMAGVELVPGSVSASTAHFLGGSLFVGSALNGLFTWALPEDWASGAGLGDTIDNSGLVEMIGPVYADIQCSAFRSLLLASGASVQMGECGIAPHSSDSAIIDHGAHLELVSHNVIDTSAGAPWFRQGSTGSFGDSNLTASGAEPLRISGDVSVSSAFACDAGFAIRDGGTLTLDALPTGSGQIELEGAEAVPYSRFSLAGNVAFGPFGTVVRSGAPVELATGAIYGANSVIISGPLCALDEEDEIVSAEFVSGVGTFAVSDGWHLVTSFSSANHPSGNSSVRLIAKIASGSVTAIRGGYDFELSESVTINEIELTAPSGAGPVWQVTAVSGTPPPPIAAGSVYRNTLYGFRYRSNEAGEWVNDIPAEIDDSDEAPSDIYVDSGTGNDANSGTEVSPIASLAEARRRIGNKNGDVTIWLISSASVDRTWSEPRIGWGRTTIRALGGPSFGESVAVEDATHLSNSGLMRYEAPGHSISEGNFVSVGDSEGLFLVCRVSGDYVYVNTGGNTGTPSPATIRQALPGAILEIPSGVSLHCGSSRSVNSGYSNRSYLELLDLNINNSGVISGGALRVGNVITSGRFTDVIFDGSGGPVLMQAYTHLHNCQTISPLYGGFYSVSMIDCGGHGPVSTDDTSSGVAAGSPFYIYGSVSYAYLSRSFCLMSCWTGDAEQFIRRIDDCTLLASVRAMGLASIERIDRSTVKLSVTECTDSNITLAGLGQIPLNLSNVSIEFTDSTPYVAAFTPILSASTLRVDKDITGAPGLSGLSFSSPYGGYRISDRSVVARKDANLQQINVAATPSLLAYGKYDTVGDHVASFGEIEDGASSYVEFEIPPNGSFTASLLLSGKDDSDVRYCEKRRIVGTAGASSILGFSDALVFSAIDDDQSDPATAKMTATVSNPSALTLRVTVENNIGGGAKIDVAARCTIEHYAILTT